MLILTAGSGQQCIEIGTVQNNDGGRTSETFAVTFSGTSEVTLNRARTVITILEAVVTEAVTIPRTTAVATPRTTEISTTTEILRTASIPVATEKPIVVSAVNVTISETAVNVTEGEAVVVCICAQFPWDWPPEEVLTVELAVLEISTCEC